jgi:non-heme chloroperoxidase
MTRFHELPDGAKLAYDDAGAGRPVVLIHGVSMSRRSFDRNLRALAERFRVVNVDLRGHGESTKSEGGHTIERYTHDLRHLIETLGLDHPVLVGWSMGSFVVWEYQRLFGADALAGHVNVSQGPTDLNRDDWQLGVFDMPGLLETLAAAQADYHALMAHFVPAMLCDEPDASDLAMLVGETQKIGANAGTCILLDQSVRDYRDVVGGFDTPTLLVFGRDEKLIKAENGAWLQRTQPNASLVVFDRSGHCPMWEEPERFNQVVGDWIAAL